MPKQNNSENLGYIPLYYSEKVSKNFIDRHNDINKIQVVASNENGLGLLKDFHISTFTSSLNTRMNFYDNYVDLYGHNFVSPVGKFGRQFYKYYLADSIMQNGHLVYTIKYVPRNEKDLAFKGKFTVVKNLWAVKELDAQLPRQANINFLNKFDIIYRYQIINDTISFFKSNSFKATFNYNKFPKNNRSMLEVNKFTVYKNVVIGQNAKPFPDVSKKDSLRKTVGLSKVDTLFTSYRDSTDDNSGTKIINSIDSINNIGWVKIANKVTNMFVTEYYNVGKYEIGPFLNLVQYNKVEGVRLSLGGRTGPLFNPNFTVGAMAGYGLKDKKWKWITDFTWKFKTERRTVLKLHASNNLQLWGVYGHIRLIKENVRTVGEDSFISAIFKRLQNDRRAFVFQVSGYVEHQWTKGFSTSLQLEGNKITGNQYVPFIQNGIDIGSIQNQEATLKLRFSWDEKTLDRFVRRYYLGSPFPIVNLLGTVGRFKAGTQTGNYYKLHMTIKHRFLIGIPMVRYVVETGVLFGKVPFPMLVIQRGNESYGLSRFRFNLLNNASVASDHYFSFMGEVFMNGIILNRIPGVRLLNIRAVVSAKYLYSSLSNKHQQVVSFPWSMSLPGNQYLELGVGITNIFKFLRVDYIWRVMPGNLPTMPQHGIRVKIDVDL